MLAEPMVDVVAVLLLRETIQGLAVGGPSSSSSMLSSPLPYASGLVTGSLLAMSLSASPPASCSATLAASTSSSLLLLAVSCRVR